MVYGSWFGGLFICENDGNAIQSGEQTWTFTKQSDGTYTIQAPNGKALTVENSSDADGANIYLNEYTGDSSQKFTLKVNKNGSYALLTVVSDGVRCADVYGISLEDGANICQWEYWGGDGQKFVLEPAVKSENEIVCGDANCDGKANAMDATLVARYSVSTATLTEQGLANSDVNLDGRINALDATIIARYAVGYVEELPFIS